jgi:hypothetical protein
VATGSIHVVPLDLLVLRPRFLFVKPALTCGAFSALGAASHGALCMDAVVLSSHVTQQSEDGRNAHGSVLSLTVRMAGASVIAP